MPNPRRPANPQSSMQVTSLSRCLIWTATAVLAVSCQAQVMQPPGNMQGRHLPFPPHHGVSNPPAVTTQTPAPGQTPGQTPVQTPGHIGATTTAPPNNSDAQPGAGQNLPPSLADKPAAPAQITLHNGSLSVDAHNSSLSEILKNLETSSGMTVDGFGKDSRVFGVYGPGSPRDVLSELLDGAGYNFLMVGSISNGAPREIVLTARSNAPASTPSQGGNSQQDEEEEAPNYPLPEQLPQPMPPPAPPVMPSADQRPRTPQEMLQELQRLRQQQQQTQPNQSSPQ